MSFLRDKKFLQYLNILTFFMTIVVNALANIIPIGGRTTGGVSDSYPDLFAPAGITFSIWSVIYTLLGIFVFYTGRDLFTKEEADIPYIEQISFYYILSNILNSIWIFSWHYDIIPLSWVLMIGIFLTLMKIYLSLNIGIEDIPTRDKILVHVPFSVYFGWISIATIANTTALLVAMGLNNFLGIPDPLWTILVIIVALILTFLMQILRKDIAFSFVVVWASIGIVIKRLNPYTLQTLINNLSVLFDPIYYEIAIVAIITAIAVSVGIVVTIIREMRD